MTGTGTLSTQNTIGNYIDDFYRFIDPDTGRQYQKDNLTAA